MRTSELGTPAVPPPTEVFGYHVIDRLGAGAGSTLYAVSHPKTHQLYAAKHVVRHTDKDSRFIDQLETEYEIGRQFSHPSLRRSIDLQVSRNLLFRVTEALLVLELFDGVPLDTRLGEPIPAVLQHFIDIAHGLAAMHDAGYVHCDFKPHNVLVGASGAIKIIDFGQSCPIGSVKKRIQGTPDYIAPEQVKLQPVTARTDIYSFGASLYWALSGQKMPTAFTTRKKKDRDALVAAGGIKSPADLNPAVPLPLSNLVMECVRADPHARPQSIADVGHRLELMHRALTRSPAVPVPAA